jgi:antitoxin component of MazEF toxin-antitoxin module
MPILTERRIVRFGENSLAVTLPKAWVKYFRLKQGDRVEVIANNELIIRVKQDRHTQK